MKNGSFASLPAWVKFMLAGIAGLAVIVLVAIATMPLWMKSFVGFAFENFNRAAQDSPAYREALERVAASDFVQRRLGTPIESDPPMPYYYQWVPNGGHYTMTFAVRGPEGDGSVEATALVRDGVVNFERLRVWVGPEGRDLLERHD